MRWGMKHQLKRFSLRRKKRKKYMQLKKRKAKKRAIWKRASLKCCKESH